MSIGNIEKSPDDGASGAVALLVQDGFYLVGQVGVEDLDDGAQGFRFFLGFGGRRTDVLLHQIQAGGLQQLLEVVEVQQVIENGELLDQGVPGIGAQLFDGCSASQV